MMISQRIINNKGRVLGILVSYVHPCNTLVSIGLAMCHKNDKFDKQVGIDLATKRAKDYNTEYNVNYMSFIDNHDCIRELNDYVTDFMARCELYYKDKAIIVPKMVYVTWD